MTVNAEAGAIDRGAQIVNTSRSELTQTISTLRGQIEAISVGAFDGRTATQFRQLMTRWDEDANRLVSALDNFESDLRDTQADFDTTDEERAASLNIETSNINFTYGA